ncbi:MAG: UvrD-helicase domain-containing protein [Acidobacteria bacterium]|nr:UvrD-helicase domain-containing protein [Acidobacteriota bacterium]
MDFLEGLNPPQREAVAHVEGPLLLLAGAGSGKTRVITHRIAHLIRQHHVSGPSILAVTFTNKAAGEMRERVEKLLGSHTTQNSPFVSTFHSFCVRLLRRNGAALAEIRPGFTTSFNIYDSDDQLSLVKAIYRQLGLDDKTFMQHRGALSAISHSKNRKEGPEDLYKRSADPKSLRLAKVFELYNDRLRAANALDFDDLLLETVRLLQHDDETRAFYNRRFQFLMIDEYQDTNRSQYELIRLLTQSHKNLCVVGDEDQSIYGWRGATIRNILDFEKDYPDAAVIRLEQNYRSTKNILEAASNLIARNTERKGKWLWTEHEDGPKIGLYQAPDGENEALFIADTIETAMRKNPRERIAVLYRTNFQSRQIEEALRRYGRKYLVVGGLSFYQRAEIKDLLAYLKVLVSPHDSISLLRIINTPARGIGKTTIEQIEQYALANNLTLWSAIERLIEDHAFPTRAETALNVFRRLIEELASGVADRPINETLSAINERTGYEKMLAADQSPDSESRLGNIEELINAAADAHERGESIHEFLDHAALVAESDDLDERAQVTLLTIHNAKGLEFPIVFLAGMEEGLFPHSRSISGDGGDPLQKMEEERRLCYVAITRAEKRLYLSWAATRRRYGGGSPEPSMASRFLKEVPSQFIEPLNAGPVTEGIDLYADRYEVRQAVNKTLYTGKTYNSLDNIAQFFSDRGLPPPRGIAPQQTPRNDPRPPTAAAPPRPVQPSFQAKSQPATPPMGTPGPRPAGAPPRRKKPFGPGSTVSHPKYGRGTILRREGEGDEAKLTISFPGYGLKKLVQKFAGMTVDE